MITSKIYKELYEILSYMDKVTVMKIPIEILQTIKNKKDNIKKLLTAKKKQAEAKEDKVVNMKQAM